MDTNTLLRQNGFTPDTVENFGQAARRAAQLSRQSGATPQSILAQIEAEFGRREYLTLRDKPRSYTMYGTPGVQFEYGVVTQMNNVARLPVYVKGAALPDAHPGYALPIGGVAALHRAVSPYGVGMDIACRMAMSIFDGLTPAQLMANRDTLFADLVAETRFGFEDFADNPRRHPVMDNPLWLDKSLPLHRHVARAGAQLGSSGGGNHFADLVTGKVVKEVPWLPLPVGVEFTALLTHSIPGSSGTASYLVNGLGNPDSLESSSHGAGRPFSRSEAKRRLMNTMRARTSSTSVALRLFYVGLALLLSNLWIYVKWHYLFVSKPGPRQVLQGFSLKIVVPVTA